jgi:hypothetical protein
MKTGDRFPHEEPLIAVILADKPSRELSAGLRNILMHQKQDPKLGEVITKLEGGGSKKGYQLSDKGLTRFKNGRRKFCIPNNMLVNLIEETHRMYGHLGSAKLYRLLSEQFTYPKLHREIRKMTATCDVCQRFKTPNSSTIADMQTVIPEGKNDLLCVDIVGPLPKGQYGHQYILTAIDGFTKFIKLYPIRRANTNIIIKIVFERHIPDVGKYKRILSDRGTQFTSPAWSRRLSQEGIKCVLCSIRHPQANQVERYHRTLKTILRIFCHRTHAAWVKWLPIVEACMNNTHNDTTEFTPMEAHFDKKPERVWDKWLGIGEETNSGEIADKLERIRGNIIRKGKMRAERKKKKDKRQATDFKIGDKILVRTNPMSDKQKGIYHGFMALYEGPYKISEFRGPATCVVSNPETKEVRGTFHVTNMKLYKE